MRRGRPSSPGERAGREPGRPILLDMTELSEPPKAAAGLRLGGTRLPLLDRARVYACGITPYDVTHLGHAAAFVWVDVLARVLRSIGVEALVCRNVTDVDDVLTEAAHRAGAYFDAFASVHQFQFDQDMTALGVRPPQFEPRARRGSAATRHSGWLPSTATTRRTRPRMTSWTPRYGGARRRGSRAGRLPGGSAVLAGTPSALRCRCRCSAWRSTSSAAGQTCGSRITPTRPRSPRR